MEIATLIFAAIGVVAVLGAFYLAARQIYDNNTEIDNLKQWNRRQGEAIDKNADRFYALQGRIEDLEEAIAGDIANMIKPKRRK